MCVGSNRFFLAYFACYTLDRKMLVDQACLSPGSPIRHQLPGAIQLETTRAVVVVVLLRRNDAPDEAPTAVHSCSPSANWFMVDAFRVGTAQADWSIRGDHQT